MFNFVKKLFDYNEKELKRLRGVVEQINSFEEKISKLSDKKLSQKTEEFKNKIADGVNPHEILPEAFAVVREAAKRTIGQRHYDVQLMAALSLWEGKVVEQKTGEGKTLSATPALYLRALEGKGAHLVTVNDYLARRDCGWMGPIFHFLGLSVGCIIPYQSFIYDSRFEISTEDERLSHLKPAARKLAYQSDITYGTNNEFGFDYLRGNMTQNLSEIAQREHFFAIVDEVDFALIDEARTPLIISSPQQEPTEKYYRFAKLASGLQSSTDYAIDEKAKTAMLTEYGIRKVERTLGVDNLYEKDFDSIHYIENALKAVTLFQKDRDYIVKDNQVIIVDEFTGRLMHGRRWSDGLHQAVEAKEGVAIQKESKTWATVTFQNYFRMYDVLSGMTGTAATEAEEFRKIYNCETVVIPTNKPIIRNNQPDVIYKTQRAKYAAVMAEIEKSHQRGQPVLVGTTSIEKNEMIGHFLKKKGIPHQILNAKHHAKEAGILAQAGKLKAVTVATNMAGRGVDIILGGEPPKKISKSKLQISKYKEAYKKWQKEHNTVIKLGGLYVIGTERHEARRIDNQLRGRAGRQGDPGGSKFFVSLEDDLMRIFGGEKIASMMTKLKMPENTPISHSMVSKMIEQIQVKIEGFNFDIRKSLVEFDDIVNKQRGIIYHQRREVLDDYQKNPAQLKEKILERIGKEIEIIVAASLDSQTVKPISSKAIMGFTEIIPIEDKEEREKLEKKIKDSSQEEATARLKDVVQVFYQLRRENLGAEVCREIEKSVLLYTIDHLWVDHLTALETLKEGVRLRGYGQRDPLVEYRKESYQMFQELLAKINFHLARRIFRVEIQKQPTVASAQKVEARGEMFVPGAVDNQAAGPSKSASKAKPVVSGQLHPGRNDPCPCGSGKKYKKCCYPKYG